MYTSQTPEQFPRPPEPVHPMTLPLPPLRLTGATVLRDGAMQRRSLAIADGRITRGPLPEVDLTGYLILPGIVDLHGDAFERQLAPRPGAMFPLDRALIATDREAAANGVTTAWLAQGWSWEGGYRAPDAAEALLAAHAALKPRFLTDLRVQLRAETHLVDEGPRLIAACARWGVGYVVFNDHLPEGLAILQRDPGALAAWARKLGRKPEDMGAAIAEAETRGRAVPRHLCRLAEAFDDLGVVYGSHDDPDGETRERYQMIGARIAEFPTTRRAAAAAAAMGAPVLLGAPNVVRGRSQAANVAARDLIAEGLCDALVSDYHYPALAQAAFAIDDAGLLPLPRAWELISTRPAEILRLPDRGRIAHGLRADLVVINEETRAVEATIAGGRLAYLAGEAGRRFVAGSAGLRMAAE